MMRFVRPTLRGNPNILGHPKIHGQRKLRGQRTRLCRVRAVPSGFTLVEILVALAILSLVMLATVAALRTFGNTATAVQGATSRVDQMRSVSGFLRGLVDAAIVGEESTDLSVGSSQTTPSYFRFGEEFFELNSTVMFGELYGGNVQVRIAREADQLVLRWREVRRRATQGWELAQSRVLLDNLNMFSVQALHRVSGEWAPVEGRARGAVLLRLRIQAGGRVWPVVSMVLRR